MKQSIREWLDSPEMQDIQRAYKETRDSYDEDAEDWWKELTYEDKLSAFYIVTKRIFKGDVVDRGSYRYVLYDVFGFDMDSYLVGMDSGYMEIHNAVCRGVEAKSDKKMVDKKAD